MSTLKDFAWFCDDFQLELQMYYINNYLMGQIVIKKIKKYIVVMDGKHARFFSNATENGAMIQVHSFDASKIHRDHKELGRSFDSGGANRHTIEPHHDEKTLEKKHFTHLVAKFLEDEHTAGSYVNLILVAPPKILGLLRQELNKHIKETVTLEIDKDLVSFSLAEIAAKLKEHILI